MALEVSDLVGSEIMIRLRASVRHSGGDGTGVLLMLTPSRK